MSYNSTFFVALTEERKYVEIGLFEGVSHIEAKYYVEVLLTFTANIYTPLNRRITITTILPLGVFT